MLDQLLFLFLTTILTLALYPVWINFVYKYHMGENIRSDGPQTHLQKKGTPTMGGLVFLLTVSLVTLLFNRSRTQTLFPIFVTSMAGLFGIMEDFAKVYKTSSLKMFLGTDRSNFLSNNRIWTSFKEFSRVVGSSSGRGIQTYQKFMIQGAIGGFVAYWTFFRLGWDYVWLPLIGNLHIGWLYPVFIFFLFIAVLNFVAFTDGVDGLAGGLALIAFGAYWVIAAALGYNSLATLAATFIGALLPFLYFNVHPARIFMGDVGSHVLGAALVIFAVVMHREVALFFILAVFLFDGISSPLQQFSVKLTGKRIFRMAPIHHHFELLGWHESKVTLRFWLAGIFFGLFGIFVALM
jgi:phospho-N-acetylmuramoyl-pentapeptide-transferase